MNSPSRMPSIFFGHGSPMNTLERNRYTEGWAEFGETIPRPKAILAISAHWYIRGTRVTAMPKPRTIHDFGGFPRALHEVQYPAAGDAALAARVAELLRPLDVKLDMDWGLDHGTWSVLVHVFPDANVPVVQLSIDATQPAAFHYELGRKLAHLREEGILIMASGNIVHNLATVRWQKDAEPYDWARSFNATVRNLLETSAHDRLIAYETLGEEARLSIPTPEHYLPLLYVLGTQGDGEAVRIFNDGIDIGSIGMTSVVIG